MHFAVQWRRKMPQTLVFRPPNYAGRYSAQQCQHCQIRRPLCIGSDEFSSGIVPWYSMCQTPQAVWPRGSGGQVPGSPPCSPNMHMAHSQELEAASRSSKTYLAENGGGRPASVQPRCCIRVQEGTGQNYLARTHGNSYVADKPRMMMMMIRTEIQNIGKL